MSKIAPIRIKTFADKHKVAGLDKTNHPLISIVDVAQFVKSTDEVN